MNKVKQKKEWNKLWKDLEMDRLKKKLQTWLDIVDIGLIRCMMTMELTTDFLKRQNVIKHDHLNFFHLCWLEWRSCDYWTHIFGRASPPQLFALMKLQTGSQCCYSGVFQFSFLSLYNDNYVSQNPLRRCAWCLVIFSDVVFGGRNHSGTVCSIGGFKWAVEKKHKLLTAATWMTHSWKIRTHSTA